jgi:hypothetical protein
MDLRRTCVLLADIVSNAVETAGPVIEAAGHELTIAVPSLPVYLDADLTRLPRQTGDADLPPVAVAGR